MPTVTLTTEVTTQNRPMYFYIKVWLEEIKDFDYLIAQAPPGEGVPGALKTLDLYVQREYGEGRPMVVNQDYLIEEVMYVDLPIVTRQEVDNLQLFLKETLQGRSHHEG